MEDGLKSNIKDGNLYCSWCDNFICEGTYHANKAFACNDCKEKGVLGKGEMIIALDHDDTFTADPELWTPFVAHAKAKGHKVSFVTFRCEQWDNEDIELNAAKLGIPIVYTNMKQKKHVFHADIWIDDSPEMCASFNDLERGYHACKDKGDTH